MFTETFANPTRSAIFHLDTANHISYNVRVNKERMTEMENTETNNSEERFCNRCGCKIEVEKELDYPFYCPNCDENMFKFETHTKKYGYAYVDEGDSADGYPRVNEILFDTKMKRVGNDEGCQDDCRST